MKDQPQQPPNPNGATRGAGNSLGAISTPADPTSRGAGNGIGAIGTPAAETKPGQLPTGMTPQQAQQAGWVYDAGFGGWNAPNGPNTFSTPASSPTNAPLGANAGLTASQAQEGTGFGSQSFGQQGFAGVATRNPDGSPALPNGASVAATGITPTPPLYGAPPINQGASYAPAGMAALPGMKFNTTPGVTAPGEPARPTGPNTVPTGNVPSLVGGDALGTAMHDAQTAAYDNATHYLDPQFKNQQDALEAKLANQGIPQNSEAWNKAMGEFSRQKEFAYSQARSGAVKEGNAAHGQLFNEGLASHATQYGENLQGAQFSNTVRQQLVNEGFTKEQIDNLEQQHRFDNSMTMRNQDINELLLQQKNPLEILSALTGGGSVTQPNFTTTPGSNVGGTDILAAIQQAYGGNLSAYNAATGNANSSNAGMAAIIAALICDRRMKTNIRMIGMHVVGVPIYEFDYLWGEHGIGVMADELEAVRPEAVITLACGIKAVDYARI